MSVRKQTCELSTDFDNRHHFEGKGKHNPHGQCWIYDFKCRFCGVKKYIAIDPSEPFDQAVYWEADA